MLIRYTMYTLVIFLYIWWSYNCIKDGIYYKKMYNKFTSSELFDMWIMVHGLAVVSWMFVKFFTIYIG